MRKCIDSLLVGGEDVEIIIVDDGSKDGTAAIADEYAAAYPDIIKAVHQENGGHGEAVNTGLRNAGGLYYKVVDSDDWLDEESLKKVIEVLKSFAQNRKRVDLMICNYVYEHVEDGTSKTIRYTRVLPEDKVFGWNQVGRFRVDQNLLMHSLIYRTKVLRESGLELPKHTFYVDNLFAYIPLPYVRSLYYMNVDLYRYYIGRSDQRSPVQFIAAKITFILYFRSSNPHVNFLCSRIPEQIHQQPPCCPANHGIVHNHNSLSPDTAFNHRQLHRHSAANHIFRRLNKFIAVEFIFYKSILQREL